jgi:SAM-dependent methyltransferase
VDTATPVRLADLGLAGRHRVDYVPSGWLTLRRILKRSEVGPDDVFVDFGSGAGRIVLEAARYPFAAVIGVELAPELHERAKANLKRCSGRLRAGRVELVNCDVLDYEIPDELTVAYFFNPFGGFVFEAVLQKLLASLERNPRKVRVIYGNPVEEAALIAVGARPVRRLRGLRPTSEWSRSNSTVLYELAPPAGATSTGRA